MKHFFLIALMAAFLSAAAQTNTICGGDSIALEISSYRGNLQWQVSYDSLSWADLYGGTTQYFLVKADYAPTRWYRARLSDGTCNPLYSDTQKFVLGTSCSFICGTSNLTDIDGNTYNTATIGHQCWMAKNLNTARYCDGSLIPNVTDGSQWSTLVSGAFCWFNNDSIANNEVYGKLYNWYALADSRSACPVGWHLPSNEEWTLLITHLGGENVAGGKMKETGTAHWNDPNLGATNQSNFSALPAGVRSGDLFDSMGMTCDFWSMDSYNAMASIRILGSWNAQVNLSSIEKTTGCSARCLRD